jgi:NADPH-dependent curcumin reductase CurA
MRADINRRILLVEKPTGKLRPENFRLTEAPAPTPRDGEALIRVRYISLDAANRAWMQGETYRSALETNSLMPGGGIAEVVESKAPGLKPGDIVFGDTGWQDYAALPVEQLTKLPRVEPLSHLISVYGLAGLTAYFGLTEIGRPKGGETIVVSAAAGSVGSFVGQIAKIKNCRAIGIAGGAEKCRWLTEHLGYDAAVDYKAGDLSSALRAAAPAGIDIYYDNVGGATLDACLPQMKLHGRIVCCGAISQYDGAPTGAGARGVPSLLIIKRLTMQGFITGDYFHRREQATADLLAWVAAGKLKIEEDVIDGLENTPAALIGLLAGDNRGKRMIKV